MAPGLRVSRSEDIDLRGFHTATENYSPVKGVLKTSFYAFTQSFFLYKLLPLTSLANSPYISIGAMLGWILSDVVAGSVHFILDNYRWADRYARFFLGDPFVSQYLVHHKYPQLLSQYSFWATNSDGLFATSVLLVFSYYSARNSPTQLSFWISYCLFTAFTNQFHKWSHERNPGYLVKMLQNANIILSPPEHYKHHANDQSNFCLTSGFCNRALEKIGWWSFLRWALG